MGIVSFLFFIRGFLILARLEIHLFADKGGYILRLSTRLFDFKCFDQFSSIND